MSDTSGAAAPAAAPAVSSFQTGLQAFKARIQADVAWAEGEVMSMVQAIEDGAEIIVEDIQGALSWLGSHIGQINNTVSAVGAGLTAMNAAGVPIPAELTTEVGKMQDAMAGVTAALNNQAIAANPSAALSGGYKLTKALQISSASAAAIIATIPMAAPASASA